MGALNALPRVVFNMQSSISSDPQKVVEVNAQDLLVIVCFSSSQVADKLCVEWKKQSEARRWSRLCFSTSRLSCDSLAL